ncbi:FAD-dependent oxidoreductase [Planctomycetales bacterium ZRK34]|nr:FAD-dependent oxidoreductase [Planctomycetales bacterium ZRK34]
MAIELDVVIFGGAGAGLWLLDELRRRGARAVLIERDALGTGQTVASQGIIHGGVKYSLKGVVSASAQAIRAMPPRWRDAYAGRREPDLTGVELRADGCWLWRTASMRSRLGMLGARAGLVVKPVSVDASQRPAVLTDCPGEVYRLDEPVIDVVKFLHAMAQRNQRLLIRGEPIELSADRIIIGDLDLRPASIVLTAGAGNEALCEQLGLVNDHPIMQRRPLHMVMVRGDLPALNGHCVDGGHTRATITSATDSAGRTVWQVGGQIAEDGVTMEPAALIPHARDELAAVLPGVSFEGVEWSTYRVDRAERAVIGGGRPEDVQIVQRGKVIAAWPTKLALAPHMSDLIVDLLGEYGIDQEYEGVDAPRPDVALPPWETSQTWNSDV